MQKYLTCTVWIRRVFWSEALLGQPELLDRREHKVLLNGKQGNNSVSTYCRIESSEWFSGFDIPLAAHNIRLDCLPIGCAFI